MSNKEVITFVEKENEDIKKNHEPVKPPINIDDGND